MPCFNVCSCSKGVTGVRETQHYRLRQPNYPGNMCFIHPHDIIWHVCFYPKPSVFHIPGDRMYFIFRHGERPPANQRGIPQYFRRHSWADRGTRHVVLDGEYTHLYPVRVSGVGPVLLSGPGRRMRRPLMVQVMGA
jgi:hypothetical protein